MQNVFDCEVADNSKKLPEFRPFNGGRNDG